MADNIYVLDLTVTGATLVTINDDGAGLDTISVQGVYAAPVEISLCNSTWAGVTVTAGGCYYDSAGNVHQLIIRGLIENAIGSNGSDVIQGTEFANRLSGEAVLTGPGEADTIHGGWGDDTIHGGAGADEVFGDGDNDLMFGDLGRDTVLGGDGRDTIDGGAGADYLDGGGSPGDMLSYESSTAGIRIGLAFGASQTGFGGDAEGDSIQGFLDVSGSDFRDVISDTNKTTLAAHANDNAFFGGAGGDRLFLGGGNDTGLGGAGDDVIWGEAGNDRLDGGTGADYLRGSAGADTLTGGAGGDTFEFRKASDSMPDLARRDVLTDFNGTDGDRIDLSAIDAATGVAGNQAFERITTAFTGTAGELRLVTQGANLKVEADLDGDAVADFAILLLNLSALGVDDIIL